MDCVCMALHTRRNGSKVTSMDGSEDDAVWCASYGEESTESVSDIDESDNELLRLCWRECINSTLVAV
ncbi:hypothetical protein C0J52_20492 [Blattella germanica]|nr:hypothetical protein C0J52_20492 [Blattella germanica]